MTTELRTSHPYHMHEAILAQPEALVRVIERNESAIDEFATRVSSCERVFLAGIGTSHHASLVGEHLMRAYGGGPDVRAVHSFDLALYGPELRREDCLVAVSHRGAKRYTALALERAREKGCPTAIITGEAGSGEGRTPSSGRWRRRARPPTPSATRPPWPCSRFSLAGLATTGQARPRCPMDSCGKSFQCVEADDLFVLIAPSGAARERTLEVADLVEEIGAPYVIFGDDTTGTRPAAAGVVRVPEVPEPFSALSCLVPLQLFAYHLALVRGTNPDSFRGDDPRFARADVSGRL